MMRCACSLALVAAFVTAVAGCASAPPVNYYVLSAGAAPAAAPDAAAVRVALSLADIPELVDRPQLVVRVAPNRVEISDLHHWGEPLRQGVPRVLAANLERHLGSRYTVSPGRQPGLPADIGVAVDIRMFEAAEDGEATVHAAWSVQRGKGPARAGQSLIRERLSESGRAAIPAAFSRALDRLARELADAVGAGG